jgi:esterase/lipase superfamily enzyme
MVLRYSFDTDMRQESVVPRKQWKYLAVIAALLFTPGVHAAKYDYCARGSGPELQKTLRVTLELDGADPGPDAPRIAAALIRRLMWDGKAERVSVEPFDETGCAAALGRSESIKLTLSTDDLDKLKAETTRGAAGGGPIAAKLAKTAQTKVQAPGVVAAPDGSYYTLQVYYATDRADTPATATAIDPGARYGANRGKGLAFGAVQVSVPREHRAGQLETPSILKLEFSPDPRRHVALRSVQPLSLDAWRAEVSKRATAHGQPGVLLFVHGYNVTFSSAALRTGQLAYDLGFPGAAMFYSWPSRGVTLEYNADQQTVEWAIPNLERLLGEVATLAAGTPVYVIAHSMGNRVFTRAFERLLAAEPARRRAFQEIVLTAPDIDAEIFRTQIAPRIVGVGPRVTLYASDNDSALSTSRRLSAGYRRLGEAGADILVLPAMDTVDASRVKTDLLGHSYFGDSDTVVSDLFRLIRDRKKPAERGVLQQVDSPAGRYWRFP